GTIGGGLLGTVSLGLPYVARSLLLVAVLAAAAFWMHDLGFEPSSETGLKRRVREVVTSSIEHGWGNRPVRLLAISAFFWGGTTIWIFYAFQPYILELYGDPDAIWLAGVSAAAFSSAQIVGGALVDRMRRSFRSRTKVVAGALALAAAAIAIVGVAAWLPMRTGFWIAIAALLATSFLYAIMEPFRGALLNDLIPARQRATILSFDSLASSAGGAAIQPALGKSADVWSLGVGYLMSAGLFALSVPFVVAVRRMGLAADRVADGHRTHKRG
ncbi:MAG TPA: MFS transporter, partial [Longimicrobiales bacterium]|nr:MFS transporter [Longimicrobiales bacterium]